MVPDSIVEYLKKNNVPFTRHWHRRAIEAQRVAQVTHTSGTRLAKAVIVDVDGEWTIAVIPAHMRLSEQMLADAVGAQHVQLVDEERFAEYFRDCEVGAEPPFGKLYGLPVILDASFPKDGRLVMRAGSHTETIEISYQDFLRLERPAVAPISQPVAPRMYRRMEEGPMLHA